MYNFSTKGIRSKRIQIEANGLRIPLLILKPLTEPENAPGVMWIHGGGYMTGMKEMAYIGRAADLVRNHGAVVIAPGYHLSLFHPYPTALNDCYATLLYIKDHAKELGINPDQIMVGGESAGGGLAAAISRQTDYSNLPPAYTFVCTAEPFYCETLKYIDDLKAAGVEAKVDVYEGMYHAFDMSESEHPTGKEAINNSNEMFAYAKEHYFAKQEE